MLFALLMNVELGPQFPEVCSIPEKGDKQKIALSKNIFYPEFIIDSDGVIRAAADLLDADAGHGRDLLGLGVLLNVHDNLGWLVDVVEHDLAGLLQVVAVRVLAQLTVFGMSPRPVKRLRQIIKIMSLNGIKTQLHM